MADRIPSTEQSFYKISQDIGSIEGSVEGLNEAIATLGEGIEALDETVEVIEAALETVVTAVESVNEQLVAQGETLEQLLDITRGPQPIELLKEEMLVPSDATFRPVEFEDVDQDVNGWMNIYQYETVSMVASINQQSYFTSPDVLPLTFDYTVSTFEQFKQAVADAASGATIYVEPGTYMVDSRIVLNRPISIYGAGDSTVFQVGTNPTDRTSFVNIFWVRASNVRLQGFKVFLNARAPSGSSPHTGFYVTEDGEWIGTPRSPGTGTVNGIRAATQIQNFQLVNVNYYSPSVATFPLLFANVQNIRVQGCNFLVRASNSAGPAANLFFSRFYGCGGDILFQENELTLNPDSLSNIYKWNHVFGFYTLHFGLRVGGELPLLVKQPGGRFTCRNNAFTDKISKLIFVEVDSNDTYPISHSTGGMDVCIEDCEYTVEDLPSSNIGAYSTGRFPFDGCSIAVTGKYLNPASPDGLDYIRSKHILDILKSVTFKNNRITGGERGLIYCRPEVQGSYPAYTPPETEPYRLRSPAYGPLPLHISDDNEIINVYPLKQEESGSFTRNAVIHDPLGDRTLVTTSVVGPIRYLATLDDVSVEGVPTPVISVPSTFDHFVTDVDEFKDALANALDGDSIYMQQGIYTFNERLVIDKSVSIYGAGIDTVIRAGSSTSDLFPVESPLVGAAGNIFIWIKSSNVKLQDLRIEILARLASTPPSTTIRGLIPITVAAEFSWQSISFNASPPKSYPVGPAQLENVELINLDIHGENEMFFPLELVSLHNFKMIGCRVHRNIDNSGSTLGRLLVRESRIFAPTGDYLFESNTFEYTLANPGSVPVGSDAFTVWTRLHQAHYNAGLTDPAIRTASGRLTVRDCTFEGHHQRLIYLNGDPGNFENPYDPDQGLEICVEGCEYSVRTPDLSPSGDAVGCSIMIDGQHHFNQNWPSGVKSQAKYFLDKVKSITFKDNVITGGERGLVFFKLHINSGTTYGWPTLYTPKEIHPATLRTTSALEIHKSGNTINNVHPLAVTEVGNVGGYPNIVSVFGDDDRTLVTTNACFSPDSISPLSVVQTDNVPVAGVQPPAPIERPGEGTLELRAEYRLVQDGLNLEFVPPTTIDILTESEKEIINPRIPAVLVGVLEIRFLIRAIDRLGDSLISLFGTIR